MAIDCTGTHPQMKMSSSIKHAAITRNVLRQILKKQCWLQKSGLAFYDIQLGNAKGFSLKPGVIKD